MERGTVSRWAAAIMGIVVLTGALFLVMDYIDGWGAGESPRAPGTVSPQGISAEASPPNSRITLYGNTYSYSHEMESYLILGTDAGGNEKASGEEYRGSMADFLLLVTLDKTEKTYSMLPLNRDTLTEVTLMQTDGSGMASARLQLCTAHWYGGSRVLSCENTVDAVSRMLGGIPIQGYYSLQMESISVLNHAVGGVTVKNESDFSNVDPSIKRGKTITLTDAQAVHYVQSRMDVDDGENISRMERQFTYLSALSDRIREKSREDAGFVLRLWQELNPYAVTDISGKTLSWLANHLTEYRNRGTFRIEGKTRLGKRLGDGLAHTEFIADKKSVQKVMTEIYHLE